MEPVIKILKGDFTSGKFAMFMGAKPLTRCSLKFVKILPVI